MRPLFFLALSAIVYLNIAGLTLAAGRFLPAGAIARAAALIGVCAVLFFVEHFVGLGPLEWTLPFLTVASCYVLWRGRGRLCRKETLRAEAVFLIAFIYSLGWKLAFPQVVELYDRLSDLHFVANYMAGAKLPPVDMWLPWQRLDYYYTFQQYSAALLARIAGLDVGTAFNIAAALLSAIVIALAWDFLESFALKPLLKLLAIVCFAIGGTGISPLYHLIVASPASGFLSTEGAKEAVLHNSRFIGWFENSVASDLWRSLSASSTARGLQLPIETFGEQFPVGGFHAPLSGFLFLLLALAVMARLALRPVNDRPQLEFLLGLSVPMTICSNAWVFPLQAIMAGSWKLWDIGAAPLRNLRWSIAGLAAGMVLILPFLSGFALDGHPIKLVRVLADQHSPWAQFLIVHWPLLLVGILAPIAGRYRGVALRFAAIFIPLLLATEILNAFDGAYSGDFIRFNPALKWWGWIFTGGFLALSTCLLASERRLARWAAIASLLLVTTFAADLAAFFIFQPKPFIAQLDGDGFYAADLANARMMAFLKNAEDGLVLENVYDERPKDTGIYGSFSGKPDLLGVPWILKVLNNRLTELPQLESNISQFFRGTHPAPLDFLTGYHIRYVVWSVRESSDMADWTTIDHAIGTDYAWMEFSSTPDRHVGVWARR